MARQEPQTFRWWSLAWLTGPIFDKEMRVASRRRRTYVMVSGYVLLLAAYLLSVWESLIGFAATAVVMASRMADVGHAVLVHVGWFQFVVVQVAALVLMGSSISSEARSGSLHVLLATPVRGVQVAVGKLLAGLLPCGVLVLISVPVLTLVGLFGGVDWRSAVASACITLSAAALSGGLAMWFSAVYRRTEGILLVSGAIFVGAYPVLLGLSWLVTLVCGGLAKAPMGGGFSGAALGLGGLAPPDRAMALSVPPTNSVVVHCTILLSAAAVPVLLAARAIRRVALARSMAGPSTAPAPAVAGWPGYPPAYLAAAPPTGPPVTAAPMSPSVASPSTAAAAALPDAAGAGPPELPAWVAAVDELPPPAPPPVPVAAATVPAAVPAAAASAGAHDDRPIFQRETLRGLFGERAPVGWFAFALAAFFAMALVSGFPSGWERSLMAPSPVDPDTLLFFTHAALGFGAFYLGLFAVTTISRDMERRFLEMLLTTPLTSWQIIRDKALAVAWRALPAYSFLPVDVLALLIGGHVGLVRGLGVLLVGAGVYAFVLGTGMYVGVRLRRTKVAVLWMMALCGGLWGLLPVLVWQVTRLAGRGVPAYWLSPFLLISREVRLGALSRGAPAIGLMAAMAAVHGMIGMLLGLRAAAWLRRGRG